MSKHEHIRKRFDEVFDLQMGKTPDRKTLSFFGGENIWLSIKDMGAKYLKDSNEHITDEAVKVSGIKKVKKGTVVMSFKLTVGKCGIAAVDLFTNEAIMAFNVKDGFNIKNDFLYYYLQGYKWQGANKAVMGLTLNKATISKQRISIPPMAEQEAIVAELDEINEAIAALQQQVADLDTLAQATFYEMFGDPVTNPKGWPTKKFSDCFKLSSGHSLTAKNFIDGPYPIYGGNGIAGYHNTFNLSGNNIIIGRVGALCGNVRNVIGEVFVTDNAFILFQKIACNNVFLVNLLNIYNLRQYAREAMQPVISNSTLKNIPIILPPMERQQEFAERVEAIEAAKTELSAQIAEMQTLLASRMDFWFAPNQPGDP